MIRRENKIRIVITCDGCGLIRADQEGQKPKWRPNKDAWREAEQAGWTSRQKPDGRDWEHFCAGCPR
jgi:hypothetical protein